MDETVKTKRKFRRTPRLSYSQEVIVRTIIKHGGQASSRQIREALLDEDFLSYNELVQSAHRKGVIVRKRIGVYTLADPFPFEFSAFLQTKTP